MSNPKTDDEVLLVRVAKEMPEVLKADISKETFDLVLKQLIHAAPAPKQNKRRKRDITKSRPTKITTTPTSRHAPEQIIHVMALGKRPVSANRKLRQTPYPPMLTARKPMNNVIGTGKSLFNGFWLWELGSLLLLLVITPTRRNSRYP
jgi:hypothetical protein